MQDCQSHKMKKYSFGAAIRVDGYVSRNIGLQASKSTPETFCSCRVETAVAVFVQHETMISTVGPEASAARRSVLLWLRSSVPMVAR
jgi:hypothetical protein